MHSKANPLEHEPSGLLANFYVAGNFVATHSILTVGQKPSCSEPLIKTDRTILVDRPNLDGELALGMVTATLPCAPRGVELANLGRVADRANDSIGPAPDSDVVNTVIRIREVDDCLLKARRFGHHGLFHEVNYATK